MAGTWRKQPQRIKAPLFQRAGGPGQLRGPANLALDFLDELSDLAGGGLRLLALDPHQRGFLLLVRKPHLERAIGDQRDADHGDKQRDVFEKQPGAHNRSIGRRSGAAGAFHRSYCLFAKMVSGRSHPNI